MSIEPADPKSPALVSLTIRARRENTFKFQRRKDDHSHEE